MQVCSGLPCWQLPAKLALCGCGGIASLPITALLALLRPRLSHWYALHLQLLENCHDMTSTCTDLAAQGHLHRFVGFV